MDTEDYNTEDGNYTTDGVNDRWCNECGCVEPGEEEEVCECCQHIIAVDKFGIPTPHEEYWEEYCSWQLIPPHDYCNSDIYAPPFYLPSYETATQEEIGMTVL